MLRILAIDTSGEQGSAAIVSPYITCGEIFFNARTGEKSWTHSEALMPAVEKLFELTRLEPADIDFVAYTNGPGSFTGLRIGAASALAIARALEIPAIPVPTLDALAHNITCGSGTIIPMLDARRGQVYTAVYFCENGVISRQTDYTAAPVEEFLQTLSVTAQLPTEIASAANTSQPNVSGCAPGSQIFFLGDGACANEKIIREKIPNAIFAPQNNNRQRASSVGMYAVRQANAVDICRKRHILSKPDNERRGHMQESTHSLEAGKNFEVGQAITSDAGDALSREIEENVEMIYVRAPQAVREAAKRPPADEKS
ncbi:MAG: tRNA (adenosine(37)-N6)-threonylcarbamoyltransferase complex dimerization subunit type 1 TsaB [Defluviitaleaceae bacterium]|nr:tRNA (adenosine(37)-N6)-threonylcarbamoyltransferase complex dimerization subunit type 1 TsaB [Defluviitaleaceae bacterium]